MLTTVWSALAALGAALIACAVAAESEWWAAIPLVAMAIAEIVWGLAVLRAGRLLACRSTLLIAVVVMLAATLMLLVRMIGLMPFVALVALHWSVAILAAVRMRQARGARSTQHRDAPQAPLRYVLAMTASAMIVAAITTPALAHTAAGELARPHGVGHHVH